MEHIIENHLLKARISSRGAELVSLVCKTDGVEHIWQGDPAVWKYHAPILFPWCGKQVGGSFTAKGRCYEAPQHGFGRNLEHRLVSRSDTELVLALDKERCAVRSIKERDEGLENFYIHLIVGGRHA